VRAVMRMMVLCLLLLLTIGCCSEKGGDARDTMPPGWHLETDGSQWRWVKPNGDIWLPLKSKKQAIENAWDHYEYKSPDWKRAMPMTDSELLIEGPPGTLIDQDRNILKYNADNKVWEWRENKDYDRGFNAALDCIMLLNLELELKHARKTFGEMNSICRQRYKIKERE